MTKTSAKVPFNLYRKAVLRRPPFYILTSAFFSVPYPSAHKCIVVPTLECPSSLTQRLHVKSWEIQFSAKIWRSIWKLKPGIPSFSGLPENGTAACAVLYIPSLSLQYIAFLRYLAAFLAVFGSFTRNPGRGSPGWNSLDFGAVIITLVPVFPAMPASSAEEKYVFSASFCVL